MRRVVHPGPLAPERLMLVPSRGYAVAFTLQSGLDLDTAIAKAMAEKGLDSAWLEIDNALVDQLAYVIPDKAPNDKTVAWYSPPHRFEGSGRINHLGLTAGQFENAIFLHGHGTWTEAGKAPKVGHILPQDTILAQDIQVQGFALEDARFERRYDAESNFSLFQPVRKAAIGNTGFALMRILPNEDFVTALDTACAGLGWQQAKVHGLGSLVGAHFEDGTQLDSFATEFLILDAIARADHALRPGPEITIVGEGGGRGMHGRLTRGDNPILVTAEIVLERTVP